MAKGQTQDGRNNSGIPDTTVFFIAICLSVCLLLHPLVVVRAYYFIFYFIVFFAARLGSTRLHSTCQLLGFVSFGSVPFRLRSCALAGRACAAPGGRISGELKVIYPRPPRGRNKKHKNTHRFISHMIRTVVHTQMT